MINTRIQPGYHQGFAREASQGIDPTIWREMVGSWDPRLGFTGRRPGYELKDTSPMGRHGTMVAGNPAWVPGPDGQVLRYTAAATHYINVGIWTEVDTGPFTLNVWVRQSAAVAGNAGIVSNNTLVNQTGPFLLQRFAANQLSFRSGDQTTGGFDVPATPEWFMVTCIRRRALVGVEAYVNGVSMGTAAGRTGIMIGQELDFGRRSRGPIYWDGDIGPVTIWRRELFVREILNLHANPHLIHQLAV